MTPTRRIRQSARLRDTERWLMRVGAQLNTCKPHERPELLLLRGQIEAEKRKLEQRLFGGAA